TCTHSRWHMSSARAPTRAPRRWRGSRRGSASPSVASSRRRRAMRDTEDHGGKGGSHPQRGIFQRHEPGCSRGARCGCPWWVRYRVRGRLHREKVGPKALAKEVYNKRKAEIAEDKFFPER